MIKPPSHALINSTFSGLGDSIKNDGNSNPLCVTDSMDTGEIRSFYCDMFGRYINLRRAVILAVAEIIINPETTGWWKIWKHLSNTDSSL